LRVVTPTLLELLLVYAALLAGLCLAGRARLLAVAAIAVVAAADTGVWIVDRYFHDDLRITFLSVGQGDSAVIELPGGEVMVVDGGGFHGATFDVGERIIAPFLWSRKIAHVDYVVLSHPQLDHYGGLAFIAEEFRPRQFWWNGAESDAAGFARLRRSLAAAGTRSLALRRGARRRLRAALAEIQSPAESEDGLGVNDRSLVLSLTYGGKRVLFVGDIERAAEENLVAEVGEHLRSTVLKVPHHGSRTSSTAAFLAAVRPDLAVISAGFGNRFGFPHADVVRRYAAASTHLLRTDRDGAVEVRIDAGGGVTVQRHRHAKSKLTLLRSRAKPQQLGD
jgi:competence protein ComEC